MTASNNIYELHRELQTCTNDFFIHCKTRLLFFSGTLQCFTFLHVIPAAGICVAAPFSFWEHRVHSCVETPIVWWNSYGQILYPSTPCPYHACHRVHLYVRFVILTCDWTVKWRNESALSLLLQANAIYFCLEQIAHVPLSRSPQSSFEDEHGLVISKNNNIMSTLAGLSFNWLISICPVSKFDQSHGLFSLSWNTFTSHDFVCIVSLQSLDKNPWKVSKFGGHPKRQIQFASGRNHKISRSIALVHTWSLWVLSHGVLNGFAWPESKLELHIACNNLQVASPCCPYFKLWNPESMAQSTDRPWKRSWSLWCHVPHSTHRFVRVILLACRKRHMQLVWKMYS